MSYADDHANNPCNICKAPPGESCPHDEPLNRATPEHRLYRGQKYGDPVGEWWTSSYDDALSFAMSRGRNRTWVVLEVQEDDQEWLAQFVFAEAVSGKDATWYRIPLDKLRERWSGVKVRNGAIELVL